MGRIAAALVILAGAIALGLGIRGVDSLTPAGGAGLILLALGLVMYAVETVREWKKHGAADRGKRPSAANRTEGSPATWTGE